MIGVTFHERLYFIRVWNDYCEISKRAKFPLRILKLSPYKKEGIIIILKGEEKEKKNSFEMHIITTLLKQVVHFSKHFHTSLIDKFEHTITVTKSEHEDKIRLSIYMLGDR